VFVLDNSATVIESEYRRQQDFIVNVVDELDVDSGRVRVALITFSDTPVIQFRLSTYSTRSAVTNAIRRVSYRGTTADIAPAFRTLRNDVFR